VRDGVQAVARRISSVAPLLLFCSKHTDSRAGPRSLSGHEVLAVTVVSPPETGSMMAEYRRLHLQLEAAAAAHALRACRTKAMPERGSS
jgi:hypothetical protein